MNHIVWSNGLRVLDGDYPAPILYGFSPSADGECFVDILDVVLSADNGDKISLVARTTCATNSGDPYTFVIDTPTFASMLVIRAHVGAGGKYPTIATWASGVRLRLDIDAMFESGANDALALVVGSRVVGSIMSGASLPLTDNLLRRISGLSTFFVFSGSLSENPDIHDYASKIIESKGYDYSMVAGAVDYEILSKLESSGYDIDSLPSISSSGFQTPGSGIVPFPFGAAALTVSAILGDPTVIGPLKLESGFFGQLMSLIEMEPKFGANLMMMTVMKLALGLDLPEPSLLRQDIINSISSSIIENESFSMESINRLTGTVERSIQALKEMEDSLSNLILGDGENTVVRESTPFDVDGFNSVEEVVLFFLVICSYSSSVIYQHEKGFMVHRGMNDIVVNVVQDAFEAMFEQLDAGALQ